MEGGLSCVNCPYKKDVERIHKEHGGPKWGPEHELEHCHGRKKPSEKEEEDGCAYLWPVWGAVNYLGNLGHLRKEFHLPDRFLDHLELEDWNTMALICGQLEKLSIEDARAGR